VQDKGSACIYRLGYFDTDFSSDKRNSWQINNMAWSCINSLLTQMVVLFTKSISSQRIFSKKALKVKGKN
jgi:hypothetical protein